MFRLVVFLALFFFTHASHSSGIDDSFDLSVVMHAVHAQAQEAGCRESLGSAFHGLFVFGSELAKCGDTSLGGRSAPDPSVVLASDELSKVLSLEGIRLLAQMAMTEAKEHDPFPMRISVDSLEALQFVLRIKTELILERGPSLRALVDWFFRLAVDGEGLPNTLAQRQILQRAGGQARTPLERAQLVSRWMMVADASDAEILEASRDCGALDDLRADLFQVSEAYRVLSGNLSDPGLRIPTRARSAERYAQLAQRIRVRTLKVFGP